MTITVTPDDTLTPPRVGIQVSVDAGGAMETVAVYRTVGGVREPIQQQPSAGLDERLVYDYWMPYEVPVVYDWETTYIDGSAFTTVFAEPWSNLSSWVVTDGSDGTWSASGGQLVRLSGPDRDAKVSHAMTPARYQIAFSAAPTNILLVDFGGFQINLESRLIVAGSLSQTFVPGTGAWTIDVTPTGISLVTDSGVFTLAVPDIEVSKIEFSGTRATLTDVGPSYNDTDPDWAALASVVASSRLFVLEVNIADGTTNRIVVYNLGTGAQHVILPLVNGTGNGQTKGAYSMCLDGSGRIVLGEMFGERVQRFTIGGSGAGTTLTYFDKWGAHGTGNGQFDLDLLGVACDGSNIYTIQGNSHRVQKFDSAGAYVTKWGTFGSGDSQFYSPFAIGADGTHVYVGDQGNTNNLTPPRVRKFTTAGVFVAKVGAVGTGALQWEYNKPPSGIAISGGTLLVADTGGRVQVMSKSFEYSSYMPGARPENNTTTLTMNGSDVYIVGRLTSPDVEKYNLIQAWADAITVKSYGGALILAETADAVVLNPVSSFLIHPSKPDLSIPIHYDDLYATAFSVIGDTVQGSNSVLHELLGVKLPVSVNTGPRSSDALQLSISTEQREEFQAMRAVLADDLPLLIRTLPSWELDFQDGFYQFGNASESRVLQMYGQPARVYSFPIRAVAAPDVDIESSGWTWAALLSEFATWADVFAAFATWSDVLSNTRRPGF